MLHLGTTYPLPLHTFQFPLLFEYIDHPLIWFTFLLSRLLDVFRQEPAGLAQLAFDRGYVVIATGLGSGVQHVRNLLVLRTRR